MTSVPKTATTYPRITPSANEAPAITPGYKQTAAGVIPQDWCVSSVGAEFNIQLGKMLDAAKNVGIPKPYIGNRSVQWGRIDSDDITTVPMTVADLQRFRLRRGDLLVCEGGEIGRAAIWEEPIPECYYQKALHRLRTKGRYDAYLMMSLLQLWTSTGYLANYVTQTSIAHLPKDKLEVVPLPVPPPAEQRAIAEALSDVDKLLGSLEKLIAKKRSIKQTAMQQLLTGKTRLPGFSGEWELGKLADFGVFRSGNGFPLAFQGHQSGDYPFFKVSDLNNKGNELLLKNANHWISEDVKRTLGATKFSAGSIVFAKIGAAIFLERKRLLSRESCLDNNMMAFSLTIPEDCEQFFHYLFLRIELGKLVSTTALPSLSGREIGAISVPLPPPDEQRAIATVLSDMDAEIAALERRRAKTRAIKQGMMQQLLTGRVRLVRPEPDGKS